MLKIILRKGTSLTQQPRFCLYWLVPLWITLGLAKAVIFTIPFRYLARCLGAPAGIAAWVPLLKQDQEVRARQIGRSIRLAARYTPWNSNCFPQAVTAHLLLSIYRIPHVMCFGLKRDAESLEYKAHAWVTAGRVAVTGGISFGQFTVVNCFVDSKGGSKVLDVMT